MTCRLCPLPALLGGEFCRPHDQEILACPSCSLPVQRGSIYAERCVACQDRFDAQTKARECANGRAAGQEAWLLSQGVTR